MIIRVVGSYSFVSDHLLSQVKYVCLQWYCPARGMTASIFLFEPSFDSHLQSVHLVPHTHYYPVLHLLARIKYFELMADIGTGVMVLIARYYSLLLRYNLPNLYEG